MAHAIRALVLSLALSTLAFGADPSPYDGFIGKWEGQWVTRSSGLVDTTLTVVSIDPEKKTAKIVYTRGGTVATGAREPVTRHGQGTFQDETTLVAGSVTYRLENGVLKATQVNSAGGNWTGVLKKTEAAEAAPAK
jgi:hypothetical protein